MIDVKVATANAIAYFNDVYKDTFNNIRIEEIELSEDAEYWFITIGYDIPSPLLVPPIKFELGAPPEFYRDYKLLKIDANKGEIISMKIRKL